MFRRFCLCLIVAGPLLNGVGCAATGPRFHKDIVLVATFPDKQNPWLNFDDPPRDIPGGIKIPVYLADSRSPLGVFGDGTLCVNMYRIDRNSDGEEQPVLVRQWEFDTQHAHLYGFKERQRVGWGYQLRLNWGDADVLGREVMFLVSFKRHDGRIIQARRTFFKVPKKV
ncbi:MAG: hypothetical protein V3W34_00695 [Phycisphaerae bacterium]